MENLYPHLPGVPPFQGYDVYVVTSGPHNLPKRNFLMKKFNTAVEVHAACRTKDEAKKIALALGNEAMKKAKPKLSPRKNGRMVAEQIGKDGFRVAVDEACREWIVTKVRVKATNG